MLQIRERSVGALPLQFVNLRFQFSSSIERTHPRQCVFYLPPPSLGRRKSAHEQRLNSIRKNQPRKIPELSSLVFASRTRPIALLFFQTHLKLPFPIGEFCHYAFRILLR